MDKTHPTNMLGKWPQINLKNFIYMFRKDSTLGNTFSRRSDAEDAFRVWGVLWIVISGSSPTFFNPSMRRPGFRALRTSAMTSAIPSRAAQTIPIAGCFLCLVDRTGPPANAFLSPMYRAPPAAAGFCSFWPQNGQCIKVFARAGLGFVYRRPNRAPRGRRYVYCVPAAPSCRRLLVCRARACP